MLTAWAVPGIGEVGPGADLPALIAGALHDAGVTLEDGDVVVVASKIVAKAESRLVAAADREDAITAESVRVVGSRPRADGGTTRIVETRHGFVMAAAGVDSSNVPHGMVLLLPEDPDASARALATGLRAATGARVGVVVTDTFGRPWRNGQVDLAIGAAHVRVLDDHRGALDSQGRPLEVSVTALADEIAAAADLVKGKTRGLPVALVRGVAAATDEPGPGVRALIRDAQHDMFRWASDEAYARGYGAGLRAAAQGEGEPA